MRWARLGNGDMLKLCETLRFESEMRFEISIRIEKCKQDVSTPFAIGSGCKSGFVTLISPIPPLSLML